MDSVEGLACIGGGSEHGRDVNWLKANGFNPKGYDFSSELVGIARERYPEIEFQAAQLPELSEITVPYDNVLCETVIMYLPKSDIERALESLKRITRPNGVLYLSWRVTEGVDTRNPDGRLYTAFEPEFILQNFESERVLHLEDRISESSKKRVCRLMYKRG